MSGAISPVGGSGGANSPSVSNTPYVQALVHDSIDTLSGLSGQAVPIGQYNETVSQAITNFLDALFTAANQQEYSALIARAVISQLGKFPSQAEISQQLNIDNGIIGAEDQSYQAYNAAVTPLQGIASNLISDISDINTDNTQLSNSSAQLSPLQQQFQDAYNTLINSGYPTDQSGLAAFESTAGGILSTAQTNYANASNSYGGAASKISDAQLSVNEYDGLISQYSASDYTTAQADAQNRNSLVGPPYPVLPVLPTVPQFTSLSLPGNQYLSQSNLPTLSWLDIGNFDLTQPIMLDAFASISLATLSAASSNASTASSAVAGPASVFSALNVVNPQLLNDPNFPASTYNSSIYNAVIQLGLAAAITNAITMLNLNESVLNNQNITPQELYASILQILTAANTIAQSSNSIIGGSPTGAQTTAQVNQAYSRSLAKSTTWNKLDLSSSPGYLAKMGQDVNNFTSATLLSATPLIASNAFQQIPIAVGGELTNPATTDAAAGAINGTVVYSGLQSLNDIFSTPDGKAAITAFLQKYPELQNLTPAQLDELSNNVSLGVSTVSFLGTTATTLQTGGDAAAGLGATGTDTSGTANYLVSVLTTGIANNDITIASSSNTEDNQYQQYIEAGDVFSAFQSNLNFSELSQVATNPDLNSQVTQSIQNVFTGTGPLNLPDQAAISGLNPDEQSAIQASIIANIEALGPNFSLTQLKGAISSALQGSGLTLTAQNEVETSLLVDFNNIEADRKADDAKNTAQNIHSIKTESKTFATHNAKFFQDKAQNDFISQLSSTPGSAAIAAASFNDFYENNVFPPLYKFLQSLMVPGANLVANGIIYNYDLHIKMAPSSVGLQIPI